MITVNATEDFWHDEHPTKNTRYVHKYLLRLV